MGRNEERHRFGSKVLCTSQNRYAIRQRLHAWSHYVSMQERAARPHWLQVQVRSSIDYPLLNVYRNQRFILTDKGRMSWEAETFVMEISLAVIRGKFSVHKTLRGNLEGTFFYIKKFIFKVQCELFHKTSSPCNLSTDIFSHEKVLITLNICRSPL